MKMNKFKKTEKKKYLKYLIDVLILFFNSFFLNNQIN
jgi:hypothetical protein